MTIEEGMRAGKPVRLTKVAACVGGLLPCPPGLYRPGLWPGQIALPVGYVLDGYLLSDLTAGLPVRLQVLRWQGELERWVYISGRVLRISGPEVTTRDAVYRLDVLPKFWVTAGPGTG